MHDRPDLTTADELRTWTGAQWQAFVSLIDALSDDLWEGPTDAAGWTVKDHVAHIIRWDESLIALVQHGIARQRTLAVPDDAWRAGGYDPMNEVIRQQMLAMPVAGLKARRDHVWHQIEAMLGSFDDEIIARPGVAFGLDYGRNESFLETLVDDLGVHYNQHRDYIHTILDLHTMTDPDAYREHAERRWGEYLALLDGLAADQWVEPTDSAGWTVKDHVAHVATWDSAFVNQALGEQSQQESLALPDEIWTAGIDLVNEAIRERRQSETPEQVYAGARQAIDASRVALTSLDLGRCACDVNLVPADDQRTLLDVFVGDQAEHYEVHRAYMRRIIDASG